MCLVPSPLHEGIAHIFRAHPDLVWTLVRDRLPQPHARQVKGRVVAASVSELHPAERHADMVIVLEGRGWKMLVVVEVQLRPDKRKHRAWPLYLAGLAARHGCDVALLVVTPRRDVERWAREPIRVGPGSTLVPWVLGPSSIPAITDVAAARREPWLAVLSGIAHGDAADLGVAHAALGALDVLPEQEALVYFDLIFESLNAAARAALEQQMRAGTHVWQSDFVKKHRAEGEAEGEAKGEVKGKAASVVLVLEGRGLRLRAKERERILACADGPTLDGWLRRAGTVASVAELLGG